MSKYFARLIRNEDFTAWDRFLRDSKAGSAWQMSAGILFNNRNGRRVDTVGVFQKNTIVMGGSALIDESSVNVNLGPVYSAAKIGAIETWLFFIKSIADAAGIKKIEITLPYLFDPEPFIRDGFASKLSNLAVQKQQKDDLQFDASSDYEQLSMRSEMLPQKVKEYFGRDEKAALKLLKQLQVLKNNPSIILLKANNNMHLCVVGYLGSYIVKLCEFGTSIHPLPLIIRLPAQKSNCFFVDDYKNLPHGQKLHKLVYSSQSKLNIVDSIKQFFGTLPYSG